MKEYFHFQTKIVVYKKKEMSGLTRWGSDKRMGVVGVEGP
jgi:hypothetical protein